MKTFIWKTRAPIARDPGRHQAPTARAAGLWWAARKSWPTRRRPTSGSSTNWMERVVDLQETQYISIDPGGVGLEVVVQDHMKAGTRRRLFDTGPAAH